ncbi:ribonuclease P [Halovenus sp. WSH3]|uniref:Ribonuclease P protein component 2 n=1 Tax=Halovenus carboxidivorans TaxID=2692199 RepID=A0A6B0TBS8_9EURY|nr:Rpp14/Pop5 family protein [Halovenus carboxidivorans]MXR53093.1 ribonuclease P [Halovenus carboxidivorans]
MKHLPKHLQPRWRYLAVDIESWPDVEMGRDEFQRRLWYSAQNLLGDAGSADLDLSVIRFEFGGGDGSAIVRTRRGEVSRARAVIAAVDAVHDHAVGLRVTGVSGTIRACEEKYMGRGREDPEQRHVAFEGADQRATVRGSRVDVPVEEAFTGATILDCE